MCGRYTITTPVEALRELFGFEGPGVNLRPRWNVAPTQEAPVVRLGSDGRRELAMFRWGLVPFWAKNPSIGSRMINARAETVADKPAFRQAFRARRCLVPADGFYEWAKGAGGRKQPYLFRTGNGAPFALADLWERWQSGDAAPLHTFTIIVTAANRMMAQYHDRMPVVLAPENYAAWLDPDTDARPLLAAPPADLFVATPVGTHVNNPHNDDPRCVEPLATVPAPALAPKREKGKRSTDGRQRRLL